MSKAFLSTPVQTFPSTLTRTFLTHRTSFTELTQQNETNPFLSVTGLLSQLPIKITLTTLFSLFTMNITQNTFILSHMFLS